MIKLSLTVTVSGFPDPPYSWRMEMCRTLQFVGLFAVVLFAIGCNEKADAPPTGPELHTGLTTSSGCDVGHIGQLANSFFKTPRQQAARPLVDALAASTPYSLSAKNAGFDIMAEMEGAVNDVPTTVADPVAGSDLINHLLLCMYNPSTEAASYPASFPDTFTVALTPSLTGAFGHRASGTAPVYARTTSIFPKYTFGFSAVGPAGSWGVVAPNVNTPSRVVFYGRPATTGTNFDPLTYDWRTIPHNASFDPDIIIAVCVEAEGNTLMLNEQSVAILSFVDAAFLDPASNCSPTTTALLDGNRSFQLARRLIRVGTGLFTPAPLMAAALSPGGVGGRSSKCCSKVGTKDVPSVSATLSNVKSRIQVNTERFSVLATAKSGADFVNGTKFTLSTTVNSGTPTSIRVAPPGTPCNLGVLPVGITGSGTNSVGTYLFTNLCFTNTGNVYIIGTANIEDRNDTPVTAKSNKINVIP
jgi:hypothetical protein